MSIIKLRDAGEAITLDLVSVEIVQGNFGQEVKFDANTGDTLYVPLSSVERQLDRCHVAEVSELAGRTIHFSRSASNKPGAKPFWNLDVARDGDTVAKPKTNGKPPVAKAEPYESPGRLPGEPPLEGSTDAKRAEIRKLHAACFKLVCEAYVKLAAENGVELSLEGVSALTYQLFAAQRAER